MYTVFKSGCVSDVYNCVADSCFSCLWKFSSCMFVVGPGLVKKACAQIFGLRLST